MGVQVPPRTQQVLDRFGASVATRLIDGEVPARELPAGADQHTTPGLAALRHRFRRGDQACRQEVRDVLRPGEPTTRRPPIIRRSSTTHPRMVTHRSSRSSIERVRRNRWSLVAAYAALSGSNQLLWLTFTPLTTEATRHYGVSTGAIGWLAEIFPLLYVVLAIPAGLALDRWLRPALGVGVALNGIGALTRMEGSYGGVLTRPDHDRRRPATHPRGRHQDRRSGGGSGRPASGHRSRFGGTVRRHARCAGEWARSSVGLGWRRWSAPRA